MPAGMANARPQQSKPLGSFRFPTGDSGSADHSSSNGSLPPSPPPKDEHYRTTSNHDRYLSDTSSVFTVRPNYLSRAGSVVSLSRESLSNQIAQLKGVQLPNSSDLKHSLKSIDSAPRLVKILLESSELIVTWMKKASQVLGGLDAGDDVEWAAAAGREGLTEVESALDFQNLFQVFIDAVEGLQARKDVTQVPREQMRTIVTQLEIVMSLWQGVKNSLKTLKKQVELAIEWEELRESIYQDITQQLEALNRAVFEMEEQRHMAKFSDPIEEANAISKDDTIDLDEINEEARKLARGVPSLQDSMRTNQSTPTTPMTPDAAGGHAEDNHLLELFARLQPLRASLDFLPMRMNLFKTKAGSIFPTACFDLERTAESLESEFNQLEGDADTVRRELAEDRWIKIFKNASKQAVKMMDSIQRSITKLDESLDSNTRLRHATGTVKKIDNYEAKKKHYCPALVQVMAIIERGAKERLTVNGELVRLQEHIQRRWKTLQADIMNLDSTLSFFEAEMKDEQLRSSVSSIFSNDRPPTSVLSTPGSSPASSIHTPSRRASNDLAPPLSASMMRQRSPARTRDMSPLSSSGNKRYSSIPIRSPKSSLDLTSAGTPRSVRQVSSPSPGPSDGSNSINRTNGYQSPYRQQFGTSTNRNLRQAQQKPATSTSTGSSPASGRKPRWTMSTHPDIVPIEGAYKTPPKSGSRISRPPSSMGANSASKSSPLAAASNRSVSSSLAPSASKAPRTAAVGPPPKTSTSRTSAGQNGSAGRRNSLAPASTAVKGRAVSGPAGR